MFTELTVKDQMEVEGGAIPVGTLIKGGIIVLGIIFIAGSMKGCTDEAAK